MFRNDRVFRKEASKLASTWSLSREAETKFLRRYLSALATPKALACWILYQHGEWTQLFDLKVNPSDYSDPISFGKDYAAVSFLSKVDSSFNTGIDTRQAALEKFWDAEKLCGETNRNLTTNKAFMASVTGPILGTAQIMAEILGSFDANEWIETMRFGPGADLSHRGFHATTPRKLTSRFECTRAFYPYAELLVQQVASFRRSSAFSTFVKGEDILTVCDGNAIITVPKNAKTDRVIAIEPHLNVFAQLGIGTLMRQRLKRAGVDLNDQRPNQALAREGSLTDQLATIDLSSASDLISRELVNSLFDHSLRGGIDSTAVNKLATWLHAMKITRSESGTIDGTRVEYQKWSSMGNGYTFELESLIFYSLARFILISNGASADELRKLNVYGDDIVIPSRFVQQLYTGLSLFGFKVNTKKSFDSGFFRESCGHDYFRGSDVRPFFLKERLHDISSCYRACNCLLRGYQQLGCTELVGLRAWLIKQLPKPLRFSCPPRYTGGRFSYRGRGKYLPERLEIDSSGITNEMSMDFVQRHHHWDGWHYYCVIEVPVLRKIAAFDVGKEFLLYNCRNGSTDSASEGRIKHGSALVQKVIRAFTPLWGDTLL